MTILPPQNGRPPTPRPPSKLVPISSEDQLHALVQSSRIVVAEFYEDSSVPCEGISSMYEDLSTALTRPDVTFTTVDAEKLQELGRKYEVKMLPTFIIFRNGEAFSRVDGAGPIELHSKVTSLVEELDTTGKAAKVENSGNSQAGVSFWTGAKLPRGYTEITDQIELNRCELLNYDSRAGSVRALFDSKVPGTLTGNKYIPKDWVESDTDEQLLLFVPFQSMIKLHTLQITSCHPVGASKDEKVPTKPYMIKLFINKTHNLGFDDAESTAATQTIFLEDSCWNDQGTANIQLKYVRFQNITSLVLFVKQGVGECEKTRIDRIRFIGETGEKREMGKLEKMGDERGE